MNELWLKLNFPIVKWKRTVERKVAKVIEMYLNNRKRPKPLFDDYILNVFDITDAKGMWLSIEDRKLYEIQIASKGKVGYTTEITAPSSSIHSSK